jgi:hypothetical protein
MSERVTRFLVSLSKDVLRMAEFGKNPDQVLADADLTEEQKTLLKSGDARRIRSYIGKDVPIYAQQSQQSIHTIVHHPPLYPPMHPGRIPAPGSAPKPPGPDRESEAA